MQRCALALMLAGQFALLGLSAIAASARAAEAPLLAAGSARSSALPETWAATAEGYSLDELQEAANYLLVRIEIGDTAPAPPILACDPDAALAKAWLSGPLHALLDEKRRQETARYRMDRAALASRIKGCASRCTCNAYLHMFEDVGTDLAGDPVHRSNIDQLGNEVRGAGSHQSLVCARKATWFCGSGLEAFLRGR